MDFVKYEGLGNDFVLVDGEFESSLALDLCDRHRGIGADGVIAITREGERFRMTVWNADGTRPEMCGNGLRCVAQHLVTTGRAERGKPFQVLTDAGPHECVVDHEVSVHMAVPSLDPVAVPVKSSAPLVDEEISVGGVRLHVTAVSMGNPHAITFDDVDVDKLGPLLEGHELFPERVNAGFATLKVTAPNETTIALRVFERGVGWTEACGTGACAAAVAAVETGRAKRNQPHVIELPGGILTITVQAANQPVIMCGPATHVFSGSR